MQWVSILFFFAVQTNARQRKVLHSKQFSLKSSLKIAFARNILQEVKKSSTTGWFKLMVSFDCLSEPWRKIIGPALRSRLRVWTRARLEERRLLGELLLTMTLMIQLTENAHLCQEIVGTNVRTMSRVRHCESALLRTSKRERCVKFNW